jgi:hypothetical protein
VVVTSLAVGTASGRPAAVTLLGSDAKLEFTQDAEDLKIHPPEKAPGDGPYCLRITGLKLP